MSPDTNSVLHQGVFPGEIRDDLVFRFSALDTDEADAFLSTGDSMLANGGHSRQSKESLRMSHPAPRPLLQSLLL